MTTPQSIATIISGAVAITAIAFFALLAFAKVELDDIDWEG